MTGIPTLLPKTSTNWIVAAYSANPALWWRNERCTKTLCLWAKQLLILVLNRAEPAPMVTSSVFKKIGGGGILNYRGQPLFCYQVCFQRKSPSQSQVKAPWSLSASYPVMNDRFKIFTNSDPQATTQSVPVLCRWCFNTWLNRQRLCPILFTILRTI